MDRSPPGSTGHGILQARILEWVAILFSGDLPNPRTKPRSSAMQEMQEMRVLSLSQEALLEKGMATHSSGWEWVGNPMDGGAWQVSCKELDMTD